MRSFLMCLILVAVVALGGCGPKEQPAKSDNGAMTEDAKTEDAKSEAGKATESDQPTGGAAAAESTEAPTAADAPAPAEPVAEETKPAADPAPEEPTREGPAAEPTGAADPSTVPLTLGSPELVAGIPGDGTLTALQIKAWLDNEANHATIEVELPLGMSKGAGEIKIPADNPLTRAKIELGRQLYFDTRLSADNTVSCASCHDPDHGYAFDTQFGVGIDGQEGGRNSPVAFNRILSDKQFWDGRAESLEAQAVGPIANPIEMGNTHEAAVLTVKNIAGYKIQFDRIFPGEGVTIDNIGKAIASFERAIVTGPSPYDYHESLTALERAHAEDLENLEEFKENDEEAHEQYLAIKKGAEAHPISESAIRGAELFFSDQSNCTACHVGANFADEKYHNLGVGMAADEPDLGRFTETNAEAHRGAFKTPTLRNIAQSAPYMHDGSQKTLEEVVAYYDQGGHPNEHLSEDVMELGLSEEEQTDLVEFMKALTGPLPKVEQGRLP